MAALILATLLLAGCVAHGALLPLPPLADPDNAAEIIVLRESRFTGSGATWPVTLNGFEVYGIRVGEHVVLRVPPGDHIIGSRYLGLTFSWEDVTVRFRAEPRGTYYFRIDPGFGQVLVNPLPPETGRALQMTTTRIPP